MGGRAAAAMIGRATERDRIVQVLAAGARGEPGAVLLRGEAGIGKTRLVTEALAQAAPTDSPERVVAVGQCVDLGSIGAPFTPIRRVLRDLHQGVGDAAFRAAAGSPAVIATLAHLMPHLADAGVDAPSATSDDYVAEAIERVIEALSRTKHLVLVIEDLHWADSASVTLLHTLAATLRGSHVTILMTVRSGDVGRGHPLRETLMEIERQRVVTTIDVPRLRPEEVAEQARALVGEALDAEQVAALAVRSDGVPFFVEELVECATANLPPTLREVTMVRVDRLSDTARSAVRLAAVGGNEVPGAVLDGVWNGGPEELATALREAVDADVLVVRGDRLAFRHSLIREAVYADLMPSEAAAMHRRYATLLQTRLDAGDVSLAALASEHWLATHDTAKAFDATVLARDFAARTLATESAAELGERLLTLWPAVTDADARAGTNQDALRLEIANEYRAAHRVRACMRIIDDALAAADPDDAGVRVPLELAYLSVSGETERASDDPLHVAEIERLVEHYDGPDAAILRARVASVACTYAPWDDRWTLAERALKLADATGDSRTRLEALRRHARVLLDSGRFEEALVDLSSARALSESLDEDRWWIVNNTVVAHLSLANYEDALRYGAARVDEAIAVGRERAIGPALSNMAEGYIAAGRLEEGLAAARRSRALLRGDSAQFTMNALQIEALGLIWADALDDASKLLALENDFASLSRSNMFWGMLWAIPTVDLAVASARDIEPQDAIGVLIAASGGLSHLADNGDTPWALDAELVSACAWLAELKRAGSALPTEILAGARTVAETYEDTPWWATSTAISLAYLATIDGADDVSAWRAAVTAAELGRTPKRFEWLSRFELGRALRDSGRETEANALFERTAREASADGVALVARWATRELDAAREPDAPSERAFATLTPREFEVLTLVADGLSNGEIGKRLFISNKTASVHVSAILAKLGASNRAEAAAFYARVGS